VTKFINSMMWQGKKSTAEGIFYKSLEKLQEKGGDEASEAVHQGRGERQAAARSEDPPRRRRELSGSDRSECRPPHVARDSLAGELCRGRGEKGMVDKLTNELLDASNGKGAAIKKKEDVHRMAEANKAFAHYRW
jgi:small subunit ribosomal protein S7